MGDDRKEKDKGKDRKAPPKPPPSTETTEMLMAALEEDLAPTGGSGDTQQIVKKLDESLRAEKPARERAGVQSPKSKVQGRRPPS